MLDEFRIINKYFKREPKEGLLGIGDDAAVLPECPPGKRLVTSTDTLVENVHFSPDVTAKSLGHKALAVNLSDLAAMGALPYCVLLSMTIPSVNADWLQQFSDGFWSLANRYSVLLVGGDMTRGPLSITVTAMGYVEKDSFLARSGANVEDDIWVSGSLGGAAAALRHKISKDKFYPNSDFSRLEKFLNYPNPRIELGRKLVGVASSAIDISDGLSKDIKNLLKASGVGALVNYSSVPCETELNILRSDVKVKALILAGGDDYELGFTANPKYAAEILEISKDLNLSCVPIGKITGEQSLKIVDESGEKIELDESGYEHF